MYVTGEPRFDPGREPHVICTAVTPRYFETLHIPIRAGRAFNEHDGPGAPPVAIVNGAAVKKIFAGQNPIGKTVVLLPSRPGEKETLVEVVGVASDTLRFGPGSDSPEEFFIPYRQSPPQRMDLVIRTRTEPASITAAVQEATASIDKDQPVYNIATMEKLLAEAVEGPRFNLMLVGSLGVIALILSAIGITGVVAYMVTLRQHEIATRMALGARQRDIYRIFLRYAALVAITGVGIGAVLSYVLGRIATRVLFGAAIADPVAIVTAAPLLIAIVFAALFIPARRAAWLDPMKVLRHA
jgi:putative ABC transport system permease protein